MSAEEKPVDDWRDDLAVFPVEGKHPLVKWRAESATREEWTGRWPKGCSGIGIDCGKSGLVVLDEDALGAVSAWLGYVPLTFTVRTGKGRHFYFLAPVGVTIRNGVRVAPGVDVRAEGGYVVGAGSMHPSGVRYSVENGGRPRPLPGDVLARLLASRDSPDESSPPPPTTTPPPTPTGERFVLPEVIEEGQRGDLLFRLACSLEARGLTNAEALPLLHEAWSRCAVPYDERTPEEMWAHVVAEYRSNLIEVEGLLVPRREFERQRDARLVWRLADRAALDRIEEAEADPVPNAHLPLLHAMRHRWVIGDPASAAGRIRDLAAEYDVDEVMVHPVAGAFTGTAVDASPAREETLRLLAKELA